MFERLALNGREFEENTREHVHEYADAGLRTLILAYRELAEEEYRVFNEQFTEAKNLVSADRDAMIDEVTERVEKDLILLGATAVEDKLQQGVSFKTPHHFLTDQNVDTYCFNLYFAIFVRFPSVLTSLPKQA